MLVHWTLVREFNKIDEGTKQYLLQERSMYGLAQ